MDQQVNTFAGNEVPGNLSKNVAVEMGLSNDLVRIPISNHNLEYAVNIVHLKAVQNKGITYFYYFFADFWENFKVSNFWQGCKSIQKYGPNCATSPETMASQNISTT